MFHKRRPLFTAALLALTALALCVLASCNSTESGNTYMRVHVDSAWYRYDSLQVLLDKGDGAAPIRLFGGKVDAASDLDRVPADGYDGGKVTLIIRAFLGDSIARAENRKYDGSRQATEEVVVVIAPKQDPRPDTVKGKDGLSIALGPKDTLLSIGDSAAFMASAGNDSGSLIEGVWDFNGDGVPELASPLSGSAATLRAGARYAQPDTYTVSLTLKGSKGNTLKTTATVRVVEDKPTADAGDDQEALPGMDVTLAGKADDHLGTIVKQEWRIGTAAFEATADGKHTFKTPAAPAKVQAIFKVTDDDGQTAQDTAFVTVTLSPDTSKDDIRLAVFPKDTLISIKDSVSFVASARNANGRLVNAVWDLDEDGKPDLNQTAAADTARFAAGFRFDKPGIYHPAITVYGGRGGGLKDSATVHVVEDRPIAHAGPDVGASPGGDVNLAGTADDSLGTIVKLEWSFNGSAFGATADGKAAFKAPSAEGEVKAVFRATDDDGLMDDDTLVVHILNPKVATLTELAVSGCALAPGFHPDSLSYTCVTAFGAASVTATAKAQGTMTLNAGALEAGKVSPPVSLASGKATLTLAVDNQGAKRTYIVNVSSGAASGNHALAGLTLSSGALAEPFNPTTLSYTAEVAGSVASVTITATVSDTTASLTVNGSAAFSGKPSASIVLGTDIKVIAVVVTAQNGQIRTYSVSVSRQSADANLKSLVVNNGQLTPPFAAGTTAYSLKVSEALSQVLVTASPENVKAGMTLNGNLLSAGVGKGAALGAGPTTINLVVTAQDTAVKKTYAITVTKVDDVAPKAPVVTAATWSAPDRPAWKWVPGGGGNGNFRYKLDNANLATGATLTTSLTSAAVADLAPGNHILYVQERDTLDNWSASGSLTLVVGALSAIADYPFDGHGIDTVGGNADATLTGAPFLGGGIYVNGVYNLPDTATGSNAQTRALNVDTTHFSVEVEFKPDGLPDYNMPILILGGYRGLGGYIGEDGKIGMVTNNSEFSAGSVAAVSGKWTTLRLEYAAGTARVLVDGVVTASAAKALVFGGPLQFHVTTTHFGNGTNFKGNLRSLRVYSKGVKVHHYGLTTNADDALPPGSPMTLTRTPFTTPGQGVSVAGVFNANDVTTGNLAALNFADLRISAEFSIAALPTSQMPVAVGGTSLGWLGAMIEPSGTLTLMYNNGLMRTTTSAVSLNAKHTLTLRYSHASGMASIYLNGVLAGTQAVATLETGPDKNVTTSYFCCGRAFKGKLYRIKVESKSP